MQNSSDNKTGGAERRTSDDLGLGFRLYRRHLNFPNSLPVGTRIASRLARFGGGDHLPLMRAVLQRWNANGGGMSLPNPAWLEAFASDGKHRKQAAVSAGKFAPSTSTGTRLVARSAESTNLPSAASLAMDTAAESSANPAGTAEKVAECSTVEGKQVNKDTDKDKNKVQKTVLSPALGETQSYAVMTQSLPAAQTLFSHDARAMSDHRGDVPRNVALPNEFIAEGAARRDATFIGPARASNANLAAPMVHSADRSAGQSRKAQSVISESLPRLAAPISAGEIRPSAQSSAASNAGLHGGDFHSKGQAIPEQESRTAKREVARIVEQPIFRRTAKERSTRHSMPASTSGPPENFSGEESHPAFPHRAGPTSAGIGANQQQPGFPAAAGQVTSLGSASESKSLGNASAEAALEAANRVSRVVASAAPNSADVATRESRPKPIHASDPVQQEHLVANTAADRVDATSLIHRESSPQSAKNVIGSTNTQPVSQGPSAGNNVGAPSSNSASASAIAAASAESAIAVRHKRYSAEAGKLVPQVGGLLRRDLDQQHDEIQPLTHVTHRPTSSTGTTSDRAQTAIGNKPETKAAAQIGTTVGTTIEHEMKSAISTAPATKTLAHGAVASNTASRLPLSQDKAEKSPDDAAALFTHSSPPIHSSSVQDEAARSAHASSTHRPAPAAREAGGGGAIAPLAHDPARFIHRSTSSAQDDHRAHVSADGSSLPHLNPQVPSGIDGSAIAPTARGGRGTATGSEDIPAALALPASTTRGDERQESPSTPEWRSLGKEHSAQHQHYAAHNTDGPLARQANSETPPSMIDAQASSPAQRKVAAAPLSVPSSVGTRAETTLRQQISPSARTLTATSSVPTLHRMPALPSLSSVYRASAGAGGSSESFLRSPGFTHRSSATADVLRAINPASAGFVSPANPASGRSVLAKASASPVGVPAPALPSANLPTVTNQSSGTLYGLKKTEIAQLANRVYDMLVRRIADEKQRRGQ